MVLIGEGPAGVVALGAAAVDRRVARVAAVGTLASYLAEGPYVGQRLGIMAPGIVRDVGDIAHLAALAAPRRVVIAGGVVRRRQAARRRAAPRVLPARVGVWDLLGAGREFSLIEATDPAGAVAALR